MSLAKSGGKIITRSVVMYGIPALTRTRTERSTESEDYLANNGVIIFHILLIKHIKYVHCGRIVLFSSI